nr:isoleucine--tRNA ligase [Saprospiraceae bacterium]
RIEQEGEYTLEVDGEKFVLSLDDFVITSEDIPGWQVVSDDGITVALDLSLTDALIHEGMARELINRIQNQRKSQGFEVTDRINIKLQSSPAVEQSIAHFKDYICQEVLADEIAIEEDVDGEVVTLTEDTSLRISLELVS